jgi:hypothetical protein
LARVGAPDVLMRERFRIKVAKTGQAFHAATLPGGRSERNANATQVNLAFGLVDLAGLVFLVEEGS